MSKLLKEPRYFNIYIMSLKKDNTYYMYIIINYNNIFGDNFKDVLTVIHF